MCRDVLGGQIASPTTIIRRARLLHHPGLARVAVSFPWIVGPDPILLSQTLFAAWLLLIGFTLLRARRSRTAPGPN